MIEKRYQYWGREGKIWTKWFPFHTRHTLSELKKKKPIMKGLLEEYREIND